MSLLYSVGPRKNPLEPNADPRFFATAQVAKTVEVRELCKACRAHSTFTMGDSMGVIETILEHIIEVLKTGDMVRLGGLGSFRVTINDQKGANTADRFTDANIKGCHVLFTPGPDMVEMCENMVYERTMSKKEMMELKKGKTEVEPTPEE